MFKKIIIAFLYAYMTAVGCWAGSDSGRSSSEISAWLTRPSALFDRATVEDYEAINSSMESLQECAKIVKCNSYIIPKKEGPTLLIIGYGQSIATREGMEKLFDCIEKELEKRLQKRVINKK